MNRNDTAVNPDYPRTRGILAAGQRYHHPWLSPVHDAFACAAGGHCIFIVSIVVGPRLAAAISLGRAPRWRV